MGLFSRSKPKIKVQTTKKDAFSGWIKCSSCTELVHRKELEQHINCCPKCGHHYRLSALERIKTLVDTDSFEEMFSDVLPLDPLNFEDSQSYPDRLEKARKKSGNEEAVLTGGCLINGAPTCLGVMDFNFMGGSMGSAVGERLTRLIEHATSSRLPLVIVSSSGGARMQESIFSLMQMAKTSAALARHHEEKLCYISILTNPTLGGVTASFASLGDIIIAEPDALIGFAGPRIVEQTIRHKLPPGAQKSEFVLEKGFIDCILPRAQLKGKLSEFLLFLGGSLKKEEVKKELLTGSTAKEKLEQLLSHGLKEQECTQTNALSQEVMI